MASPSKPMLGKSVEEDTTEESFRFKVLCSAIKGDKWLHFPCFTAGEHFWRFSCLPNKKTDYLSFDLYYGGQWKDLNVKVDLGLLKNDEALSSVQWRTIEHTFARCGSHFRFEKFAQGNELKRCLNDDYFIIICKIRIISSDRALDSGVTILSSLIGKSKSHNFEMPSSERGITKELTSGLFQFKVMCSHITAVNNSSFPIFMVGDYCWQIGYHYVIRSNLSFYFYVRNATKDLKVSIEFGVLKKDEGASSVKWQTITHTFQKCGEEIYMHKFIESSELKKHLQEEYFRVICNLTILSETVTSDHDVTIVNTIAEPIIQADNEPVSSNLQDHLIKMFKNEKNTDVIFEVGETNFHAHKLVLAAQSSVFSAELFGPTDENYTKKVKIDGIQPRVFKAILYFLYTNLLPDINESNSGENEEINQMFLDLLVASDRYEIESLKLMCEGKLSEIITVDTVATTLALADAHNCPNLKDACLEFATSPQNFTKVAITDGYRHLLLRCPTILTDLGEKLHSRSN